MSWIHKRAPVGALHRHISLRAETASTLPTVTSTVKTLRPEEPLHCIRPGVIAASSRAFVQAFSGDVLYAVKCNPEPAVLRAVLGRAGCGILTALRSLRSSLVRRMFPDAAIHFMHPVKSRAAIREAWMLNGVHDFVFDSETELNKILDVLATCDTTTLDAKPGLFIRLALPRAGAAIDLSSKFGADVETAVSLLRAARPAAGRLGVAFHVGSQCVDPLAWRNAMALAGQVIAEAEVQVDVIDVGGGFPVAYPDVDPPPLSSAFMTGDHHGGHGQLQICTGIKLWAEPGRALVAGGGAIVVQVQLRKDNMLYVNDGVYGALADAGALNFRFPTRLIRPEGAAGKADASNNAGPSCDSLDVMHGPFMLPDDAAEGDWIEIGQLGAYGSCLRTAFNGFDRAILVEVSDRAMLETAGYAVTAATRPSDLFKAA